MSLAYYTVETDLIHSPTSFIVRVYREGDVVVTANFPICNPESPGCACNEAHEFGRLYVKALLTGWAV